MGPTCSLFNGCWGLFLRNWMQPEFQDDYSFAGNENEWVWVCECVRVSVSVCMCEWVCVCVSECVCVCMTVTVTICTKLILDNFL